MFESPDLKLLLECLEEYKKAGEFIRAIYVRLLIGEWMGSQTVSFRERAQWSWDEFWSLLHEDHIHAGLLSRLPALI